MDETKIEITPINDIKTLTKRIDNIEHRDIAEIKEDITNIKSELYGNKIIIEQNTKVLDKLSNTLDKTTKTMVELSMNVKYSNESIDKLEGKIDAVRNNLKTVEEKSKFDIMCWIRDNFLSVVLAIGALAYIVTQIVQ